MLFSILLVTMTEESESAPAILKSTFDRPATTWPRRNPPRLAVQSRTKENNLKNIFVGNLAFGATESGIRSLFERYGTVDRVNLVTDRDTGRSRGFAFVEMSDSAQADQAIQALNGAELDGRALNVNEARPKNEGGFSRGPRGGGRQRREPRW
jgi:RNA recognition motif-containing protein